MRRISSLLVFVVAFVGCARSREELPLAGRYDLALIAHATMPQGADPFDVNLRAELELAPTASADVYLGRLLEARFEANAEQASDFERLRAELERPFAVRFENGRVVEHRLSGKPTGFAVATLRAITAGLQRPPAAFDEKTSLREFDSTGEYEARYARTAQGYRKEKLRYTRLLGAGQVLSQQIPEIQSAQVELVFAAERLERVVSREVIRAPLMNGLAIEVENQLRLTRKLAQIETASDAALAALALSVKAEDAYVDPPPLAALGQARDDGRSVAELIAALEAAQAPSEGLYGAVNGQSVSPETAQTQEKELADRMSAFSVLVGKLRADEAAAEQVMAAVRAGSPAGRQLMSALVSSGRSAGLIAYARDASVEVVNRRAAVSALIRSEHPSPAEIDLLLSLLSDDAFEEHVRYGLGTFARRLRDQGEPERAKALVRPLLDELAKTDNQRRRIILLRGLANAGSPLVVPAVRGDLVSEVVVLREAAIYALALVPGDEVDAIYAERLRVEPEKHLRELLLSRIAQHRPPSEKLLRALDDLLADEGAAPLWKSIVYVLAPWRTKVEGARALLEKTAQSHRDGALREAARAAIASDERKPV